MEANVTVTPAEPAGDDKVTVPVDEVPPVTVVGLSDTLPIVPWVDAAPGLTVRLADTVLVDVAEIVPWVEFGTLEVVTVNVALL